MNIISQQTKFKNQKWLQILNQDFLKLVDDKNNTYINYLQAKDSFKNKLLT